jgi:hypothetical protein
MCLKSVASIRADLDDMEFEFVQGTELHTEGETYVTKFMTRSG